MTFEWLVALRYLRSPNRPAVLRLVTLLAVIGVTAGVTTLVIALSMNTGFRQEIRDRLLTVTAHVNLKPTDSAEGIRDYRELMAQLNGTPGVQSIVPAIYNTVLLSAGPHSRGIVLKGVDPDLERKSSEALRHMVAGSADFAPDVDGLPALLVGRILADDLKISAGDYVTLISPQGSLTPFGMVPHPEAISRQRNIRFGVLRLRRELGVRDAAFGAVVGGIGRCDQPARSQGREPG